MSQIPKISKQLKATDVGSTFLALVNEQLIAGTNNVIDGFNEQLKAKDTAVAAAQLAQSEADRASQLAMEPLSTIRLEKLCNPLYKLNEADLLCSRATAAAKRDIYGGFTTVDIDECRGLISEGPATNQILPSSDFTGWQTSSTGSAAIPTITQSSLMAPNGSIAQSIQFNLNGALTSESTARLSLNYTASGQYVFSVWLRSDVECQLYLHSIDQSKLITVKRHWSRHIVNGNFVGSSNVSIRAVGGTSADITNVQAWCAQVETGNYASSPIETTSAPVTRAGEYLRVDARYKVPPLHNPHSIVIDCLSMPSADATLWAIPTIENGNVINSSYRLFWANNQLIAQISVDPLVRIIANDVDPDQSHQYIVTVDDAQVKLYIDGILKGSDTIVNHPELAQNGELALGSRNQSVSHSNINIKQMAIYDFAFNSEEAMLWT